MACFGEDDVPLRIPALPLCHVIEEHKNTGAVVIGMNKATSVNEKSSSANARKIMLDLIANDGFCFRHNHGEEIAKIWNIPLPIAKLKERATKDFIPLRLESS
jgi:hypothetical protein